MSTQKKYHLTGFTLIELVVVIILLGILSAVALPRFMKITDEAQEATARDILNSFRTGLETAKAQWLLNGGYNAATAFEDGNPISLRKKGVLDTQMNKNGYVDGASSDGTTLTAANKDTYHIGWSFSTPITNRVCKNIFINLMSESSSKNLIAQDDGNNVSDCNNGLKGNPNGPAADICAAFHTRPHANRCEYTLFYKAATAAKRFSIWYIITVPEVGSTLATPDMVPGSALLYKLASNKETVTW